MLVAAVVERSGASRADVFRVVTTGGVSASDWVVAHAIEAVTGRPAAEIMWAARSREPQSERPAPSNRNAVFDPSVRVYEESPGPDAPQKPLPDYPTADQADDVEVGQEDEVDEETDPGRAAWSELLETRVWPLVAEITGGHRGDVIEVRRWTTARAALAGLEALARRTATRTPTRTTTVAAALAA